MIKKIYIIRHGQTSYNKDNRIQGKGIDSSLNDHGKWQAEAFYKHFSHIPFDKIYTSALKRSIETVQPFVLRKKTPVESLKELNEISWGNNEGKKINFQSTEYQVMTQNWNQGNLDYKFEGGESPNEVLERQKKAMKYIMEKQKEDTIMICIHGRAIRILICYLLNLPLTQMEQILHDNLCLYLLEYRNGNFFLLKKNDISHLKK